jgi:single-strand DNA-binding protein
MGPTVAQKFKNEVHLHGVLSADPEVRQTATGKSVASLTVITKHEQYTEYHRVVAWGQLAEKAAALSKGGFVRILGRLQTSSWVDKTTNTKRYKTEIICWQLSLEQEPLIPSYDRPHGGTDAAKAILKPPQPKGGPIVNAHGAEITDEDIPF